MQPNIDTHRLPRLADLGEDLLQLTQWQRVRTLAWPFAAFGAYWFFAWQAQWPLAILATIVLSFVTYGSTSHDLVHRSLRLPKFWNELLLSIVELITLRSGHAYRAVHLHHHARFPNADDIEAEASRMSLPRALAEGMVFQFRTYAWAFRHARTDRNWILFEGVAVATLVFGAIVTLPWTLVPAVYVSLMIAGSWIIPLITSYVPHDPSAADELHQTRLFRGLRYRIIALDHLYHLEHHLFPAVPHQNWPRLAQRLDPWFERSGLIPTQSD